MRFRNLLAILGILVVPFVTPAKSPNGTTAKKLGDACKVELPSASLGLCIGYIDGYLDGSEIYPVHPDPNLVYLFIQAEGDPKAGEKVQIRFTAEYTLDQFRKAFVVYLAAHPEQENSPAGDVLF